MARKPEPDKNATPPAEAAPAVQDPEDTTEAIAAEPHDNSPINEREGERSASCKEMKKNCEQAIELVRSCKGHPAVEFLASSVIMQIRDLKQAVESNLN